MRLWPALLLLAACDTRAVEPQPYTATGARQEVAVPIPPGSVPRGAAAYRAMLETGPPVTPELLELGRQSYLTFCAACHGPTGLGNGRAVDQGFPPPTAFTALPPGALAPPRTVAVITNGYGLMLPQAEQVPPAERWAIAYHVARLGRAP